MHLQADIVVARTNEQVWSFFGELANLVRWDRSVAQVIPTSGEPFGVGSTFDTIAPAPRSRPGKAGARLSYRCTEYVPNCQVKLLLTNSHMFKYAEWTMTTDDMAGGVRITCQLDAILRLRYSFLLLVLLLTYKQAFRRDLTSLQHAIEHNEPAAYSLPSASTPI